MELMAALVDMCSPLCQFSQDRIILLKLVRADPMLIQHTLMVVRLQVLVAAVVVEPKLAELQF